MDGNAFKDLETVFDGMVSLIIGLALAVLVLLLTLVGIGFWALIYFWG